MKLITYINDHYSIKKTLEHLLDMFQQHKSALQNHLENNQRLHLRIGEIEANGQFLELKCPKSFKSKYPRGKQLTSELLFFEVISQHQEFFNLMSELIEAITEYNRRHKPLWGDKSSFFGINIAIPLATKNQHFIPALIHFLSSTDLHKEKTLSSDLDRIFTQDQWTPEVMDLLAARATILKGRFGHVHISNLLTRTSLQAHLAEDQNQNSLLEKITIYALLNYTELSGKKCPRLTIENAVQPFLPISETMEMKCKFIIQSFVDNFPNYLPTAKHTINHSGFR
ncbi:hypothetical protein [Litoribacillus peritrichatus]|uniref:Uncharacterized protein n=1 Tax=Litoribacillus peritrichatus TaxID=718191 RepID=A0ABP7MPR7_9GAMM